jgi:pimeloyl-ACP methyl ester carboxylesterase
MSRFPAAGAVLLAAALSFGAGLSVAESADTPDELSADGEKIPGQPYEKRTTHDRFGREVTFYLSETVAPAGGDSLPLVAYIEGSGCGSRFEERNGRIRPAGGHIVVAEVFRGRARVVVVEKPGVEYLAQPQGGCEEMEEFNREHTLERWAEANEAAIRAVGALPGIDNRRTLVIGHSEGGLVACRVARDLPEVVTHVASIAGGGLSQLFDILALARRGEFFDRVSDDPERRVQHVIDEWKAIQADPMNDRKFFFGFAWRRWSTFLASSPLEELADVPARIYIAQGTADLAVDVASADALHAHLLARNKPVQYDRVEGGDHSFRIEGKPEVDGWEELFGRIGEWFDR